MKKVKQRLQKELQSLRKQQRELQKTIDSNASENEGDAKKAEKSGYCKICKLIFKHRSKAEHDKTEFHKKVVSFLYPECTFCKIPKFFSPMAYEKHIATLGHIKVYIPRSYSYFILLFIILRNLHKIISTTCF